MSGYGAQLESYEGFHELKPDLNFKNEKCFNCNGGGTGANTLFLDYEECCVVCHKCGVVNFEQCMFVACLSNYRKERAKILRGAPTRYNRNYHLSERLAQWLTIGPSAPVFVVQAVYLSWMRRRRGGRGRLTQRFDPRQKKRKGQAYDRILNAHFVKKVCRLIGQSKYAERWIQIRAECLRRENIPNTMILPDFTEFDQLIIKFKQASNAFDRLLYRGGTRYTPKDSNFNSKHELSRHNMPNYNLVIHQILWQLEIRKKIDAHFYFPLLVTEKVVRKLLCMWQLIADECGWEVCDYDTLVDRTYSRDWEVVFAKLK